ncbi:Probable WRKY transcription factor 75 [Linum grandiflorum]
MEMNYTASFFPYSSSSTSSSMNMGDLDQDQHHQHEVLTMVDDRTEEEAPRDDDGKGVEEGDGEKNKKKKVKKPKYAFQTRSQVDILDDGYRWRNSLDAACRSYYRCTYQGCNVKKQVQRLTKDESMVVTTYEGIHSHPIEKSTDNFEHILNQMHIYASF